MQNKKVSESGFSIVEMLIVIAVLGIVTVFALINFNKPKVQLQRQNLARQLQSFFERARADSIKRRAEFPAEMARITLENTNSLILLSDLNFDGILETNEIRRILLPPANKITGNKLIYPITVSFNYRGHVFATDANNTAINPVFTVCDADCSPTGANSENSNIIAISPTGTINYLEGGKSLLDANLQNPLQIETNFKINRNGTVYN